MRSYRCLQELYNRLACPILKSHSTHSELIWIVVMPNWFNNCFCQIITFSNPFIQISKNMSFLSSNTKCIRLKLYLFWLKIKWLLFISCRVWHYFVQVRIIISPRNYLFIRRRYLFCEFFCEKTVRYARTT